MAESLVSKVFGYLTVSRQVESVLRTDQMGFRSVYECVCVCGNKVIKLGVDLKRGRGKSCGCKTQELYSTTCLERYGVDNANKNNDIKAKKKQTFLRNYGVDHPFKNAKVSNKMKKTMKKRYGVHNPSQVPEFQLKIAKTSNRAQVLVHWKTGQELICVGSYEVASVAYLNLNRIEYEWQPKVFKLSNGKTYRPDLFLVDEDKWVEIKGYFRDDALEKWNIFRDMMPNSILWDKEKLKEMKVL